MRSAVLLFSLMLPLAGCADNYTADKSGVTQQQQAADLYQCAGSTGEEMTVNPGSPGSNVSMQADALTTAAVMECLKARGYTITAK
jgi:hypothetical protein